MRDRASRHHSCHGLPPGGVGSIPSSPFILRGLVVSALFFLSACASPVSLHKVQPAAELQWPPQQGAGRKIVWVRTIAGYQDAGIGKGFWKRALEVFTGAAERPI